MRRKNSRRGTRAGAYKLSSSAPPEALQWSENQLWNSLIIFFAGLVSVWECAWHGSWGDVIVTGGTGHETPQHAVPTPLSWYSVTNGSHLSPTNSKHIASCSLGTCKHEWVSRCGCHSLPCPCGKNRWFSSSTLPTLLTPSGAQVMPVGPIDGGVMSAKVSCSNLRGRVVNFGEPERTHGLTKVNNRIVVDPALSL